jgi:hypothetical protein
VTSFGWPGVPQIFKKEGSRGRWCSRCSRVLCIEKHSCFFTIVLIHSFIHFIIIVPQKRDDGRLMLWHLGTDFDWTVIE